MRKLQIGVMGSSADLKYSKRLGNIAFETGAIIAKSGNITVYGAEKDYDSLSTVAARGAKKYGGLTVGITYGSDKNLSDGNGLTDVIICSGMERGGGREFVLVNSCDAIILISGGSGTLNEAVIAYQLNIPIIAIKNTGGWADKLAGSYIDKRNRLKVISVNNPQKAVEVAISSVVNKNKRIKKARR